MKAPTQEIPPGYHFSNPGLLQRALTRKAYACEQRQKGRECADQEVFATLGDAVIRLVLVDLLLEAGAASPDEITRYKRELEREEVLAGIAREIGLGPSLILGKGEEKQMADLQPYVLAESLEAVFGAVYLDRGFSEAFSVAQRFFKAKVLEIVAQGKQTGKNPGFPGRP